MVRWLKGLPLAIFAISAGFALSACDVEGPTFSTDAGQPSPDASVDAGDAGFDAGPCRDPDGEVYTADAGEVGTSTQTPVVGTICTASQYCALDGICKKVCTSSSDCDESDICARPVVITSTAGHCQSNPAACTNNRDCLTSQVCLPCGACGPKAARAELFDRTLVPLANCTQASDCGLAGVCRQGVCTDCRSNADCQGSLRCESGSCIEATRCSSNVDCLGSNECNGGRCLRRTSECPPSINASGGTASLIEDGHYLDQTICGDEENWYRIDLPDGLGMQVILTSTLSQATLWAEILSPNGAPPPFSTRLNLPGIQVLSTPASHEQVVYVQVFSRDATGDYDLVVQYSAGQCSLDPTELYGSTLSIPTNITFEGTLCPERNEWLYFNIEGGDSIEADLTMTGEYEDYTPNPQVSVLDTMGGEVSANSATPTSARATTQVLSAAQPLTLSASAERLSSAGDTYRMRLVRHLAGRDGACQMPSTIDPRSGPAGATGDLSLGSDLGRADCTGVEDAPDFANATRNDLLYALSATTEDTLVIATLTSIAGTEPRLSIALLNECATDTSALACDTAVFARSSARLQAVVPAGATPTLMVSSNGEVDDVQFDLHVEYVSLASFDDDLCANPTPLTETGTQTVHVFGGLRDTVRWGAGNDDALWADRVSTACNLYSDTGHGVDRYFSLDLDADELAAVELTGPLGGMLWSALACDDMPGTCQQAALRDFSSPVLRATFTASTAGRRHILVVDGSEATDQGSYTLRTIRQAQCLSDADCQGANLNLCGASPCRCDDYQCQTAPANDRCPGTALNLGTGLGATEITGSTGAAEDDYAPSCLATGQPDVVYSVQVPEGATELVARIVGATFDPGLEIRQDVCVDTPNVRTWCVDDVRYPDVLLPEVRIAEPEAGTYYLVVDAYAGEGAFTLQVEVL